MKVVGRGFDSSSLWAGLNRIGSVSDLAIEPHPEVWKHEGLLRIVSKTETLPIIVSTRMLFEGLRGGIPAGQQVATIPGSTAAKSALGTSIGFLTGIIGLGGGYALVPSLIYFLKSPVKLAIGTSMAAFVWMALVGSAFKFYQQVVNVPVAATLGIGAAIGAIFGAKLVAKFNPNALKALFGVLFLYVSLKYILIFFGVHI